jgi:MFS family permease
MTAVPVALAKVGGRYPVSFWVVSCSFILLIASAGAPVPLFAVYQAEHGVGDSDLTTAFAIYVVAVAAALLLFGRLSDVCGRRSVGVAAFVMGAAASVLMSRVGGTSDLYIGRALQGIAIGTGSSALGAWTYELRPDAPRLASAVVSGAPTGGLACGALLGGVLLDWIPGGEHLVMMVLASAVGLAAVFTMFAHETTTTSTRAAGSARPSFQLPLGARLVFAAAAGIGTANWAMGGFYQSLVPSVLVRELEVATHVVSGVAVAALVGTSALTGIAAKRVSTFVLVLAGALLFAAGATGLVVAFWQGSAVLLIVATVAIGGGHGLTFLLAVRSVAERCAPADRAGVLAAFYLVCYLGSVLPMLAAGWGANHGGLSLTMTVLMGAACLMATLSGVVAARVGNVLA